MKFNTKLENAQNQSNYKILQWKKIKETRIDFSILIADFVFYVINFFFQPCGEFMKKQSGRS